MSQVSRMKLASRMKLTRKMSRNMKKIPLFLMICLLILPICAYADDDSSDKPQPDQIDEDSPSDSSGGSGHIKNRIFELGFLNINIGLSSDVLGFADGYLSLGDIFQETIVLDIDKFPNGLRINLGANIVPVYFNINLGNWGIGISTNLEAMGSLELSGKLLTFSKAIDNKSDMSGALFASAEVSAFFNIDKLKVKFKPSLFYTIAYFKPDISYTFDPESGNIFKIDYDMRIYTAFPVEDAASILNDFSLLPMPGIDFSFGVEYALANDFDVGLEFVNIPIIPSVLKNYMQFAGTIGDNNQIDLLSSGLSSLFTLLNSIDEEPSYGTGIQETARPFRLFTWVNWRVLGTPFLTLTPMLGFSINQLYVENFSMEFGMNARFNWSNMFVITTGINYIDRIWRNGVNFAFNLRLFEFNIGLDMRSHDFIQSWTGGGFGINMGFMIGW
jgi:hypothetical protein